MLELQRFLGDQGYFPRLRETPDGYTGYFGDLTKEALQAWQQDRNIAADGCFGPTCRQAVALQQVSSSELGIRTASVVYKRRRRPQVCRTLALV